MAQVTVTIDGKAYRMACEEGQEAHLTDLAGRFDRYVLHLKEQFGEIGDLRITVMAGIMIMDEVADLTGQIGRLQAEVDALRGKQDTALAANARTEEALAGVLEEVAGSIRGITEKLTTRASAETH